MRIFARFGALVSLVTVACGPSPARLEDARSPLGAHGEVVSVLGAGPYSRVRACSGICVSAHYFWADIAVRNDAFDKAVGVRYSADGWQTYQVAYAHFEEDLGNGWERWGLDVELGTSQYRPYSEIELAAFAKMGGAEHWDPKNNYYVYASVFPDAPVRLLSSAVRYDAVRGGVLEGRVRVFDLDYEKKVVLRYSVDDWQTWQEASAWWVRGDDWAFEADQLIDASGRLPDEVRFAVRYEALGETYWDNNRGQDFVRRLHPRFNVQSDLPIGSDWAGIFAPSATPQSDLPLTSTEVRLDGGEWQAGDRLVLSTWELGAGPHLVEVRVRTEGGYQALQRLPFGARDRIAPQDTWSPRPDVESAVRRTSAWQTALDGQGRVLVLWDSSRIGRYLSMGDVNAPYLFEPAPDRGRITSFAVDASDRVYAVGGDRALVRWTEAGGLDHAFGDAGRVSLDGTYAGRTICYAGQLVAGPSALYLPDTCNRRVLRFDLQGNFTGALDVGIEGRSGVPVHGVHDGQALWLASQGDLLRIVDGAVGLKLVDRLPLSESLSVSGVAVDPDVGFWVTTSANQLARVSSTGEVLAKWNGGPRDAPFEGSFTLARSPLVHADGTVSVLGVEGAKLVRFARGLLP